MKFYLLSYNPGMFGEFTADMIQQAGENFYNKSPSITNKDNRVFYPNYLSPIKRDLKTYSSPPLFFNDTELQILDSIYKNSNVCLPTHWYHPLSNTNLPSSFIRLYADDITHINLAFCMGWIKSHATSTIWPDRKKDIKQFIDNGHQHSDLFKLLLSDSNSKNWQYLAVIYDLLNCGKFDLDYFLRKRYEHYILISRKTSIPNWNYLDIGKLIHGDMSNIGDLESIISGKVYKFMIRNYANQNLKLLKDTTKLDLNSLNGDEWLDNLIDYCFSINYT